MKRRFPVVTLIVVLAALVVAVSSGLPALFVYDREAISQGEWWRLLTGNWVHLSWKHLFYDTSVFAIAGCIIETSRLKNFGWLCIAAPLLIGVSLYAFTPRLAFFGGLSGMGTAAVTFWALNGLTVKNRWRAVYLMLLCLDILKVVFEFGNDGFVFMRFGDNTIRSVPLNHLVGMLSACLIYALSRFKDRGWVGRDRVSSAAFSPANLSR